MAKSFFINALKTKVYKRRIGPADNQRGAIGQQQQNHQGTGI
jgi:hypothetical protein